jgi:PAS domain S-box-containing protein
VPALIGYFDRDRIYRYVNKGYADWFGRSKDRIVGQAIAEVVPEEVMVAIRHHVDLALEGQRVRYEYAMTRHDGQIVHARSELVPEIGPDGEVLGCFVLSVDISELKAAQAARMQAQKMEAVVQLTGGLAHDFNNMLAVMIGNLAALRDRHPDNPEFEEYLAPALKAAHSGATLIRRLLAFARQQPLAPEPVAVAALIDDAVQLLRRSLPDTIRVVTVVDTPRLYALTDAHQLESALLNLAINARDAMPDGGELRLEACTVHLGAPAAAAVDVPPGDYVRVNVTDTGIGMDSATQTRVFEPFFTTKRFGSGSGLGLSMVYGFVRQCGGTIILRSEPGQGTQVSLLLPQARAPQPAGATDPVGRLALPPDEDDEAAFDDEAGTEPVPLSGEPGQSATRSLVLLVEDHEELRRVIRRQLVGLGYSVIEAGSGREALDLLDNVPGIALLISDIVMPGGIDGRELCRRAGAQYPGLRMLLISGYADEQGPDATPAGHWPLLRKPFSSTELGHALDGLGVA